MGKSRARNPTLAEKKIITAGKLKSPESSSSQGSPNGQ